MIPQPKSILTLWPKNITVPIFDTKFSKGIAITHSILEKVSPILDISILYGNINHPEQVVKLQKYEVKIVTHCITTN